MPLSMAIFFRSCVITENNQKNYNVGQGYLGRPWGKLAQVTFLNTLLDDESKMNKEGYFSMSGNQPENARYQSTIQSFLMAVLLTQALERARCSLTMRLQL